MSISQRALDYCERIRTRVDNWAQGKGYGPGGFSKDTAEHDVVFLLNHIADLKEIIIDLEDRANEARIWRGRYNALLRETEEHKDRIEREEER